MTEAETALLLAIAEEVARELGRRAAINPAAHLANLEGLARAMNAVKNEIDELPPAA